MLSGMLSAYLPDPSDSVCPGLRPSLYYVIRYSSIPIDPIRPMTEKIYRRARRNARLRGTYAEEICTSM